MASDDKVFHDSRSAPRMPQDEIAGAMAKKGAPAPAVTPPANVPETGVPVSVTQPK
jgi:hypothetical protein